jgi:D-alanine-D-alanine ligase
MKKLRLALLAGGKSGEREVSLTGAEEVAKALDPKKYEITRYDPATDLAKLATEADNFDAAFILLHGPFGEDGTVQGFLDLLARVQGCWAAPLPWTRTWPRSSTAMQV